jgi:hypothetical protein
VSEAASHGSAVANSPQMAAATIRSIMVALTYTNGEINLPGARSTVVTRFYSHFHLLRPDKTCLLNAMQSYTYFNATYEEKN